MLKWYGLLTDLMRKLEQDHLPIQNATFYLKSDVYEAVCNEMGYPDVRETGRFCGVPVIKLTDSYLYAARLTVSDGIFLHRYDLQYDGTVIERIN